MLPMKASECRWRSVTLVTWSFSGQISSTRASRSKEQTGAVKSAERLVLVMSFFLYSSLGVQSVAIFRLLMTGYVLLSRYG